MDVVQKMREAEGFTPTEQELAHTILCLGPRFSDYSIKELAQAAHCSIATIHRLCRKLGLEGMKELKVEMARSLERAQAAGTADINFPFGEGWTAGEVAASIRSVFEQTLAQTQSMLDMDTVEHAASLICTARRVGLFTESHNRYPASMFADRLLSVGIDARCEADTERQIRCALLMGKDCVAIGISYSGVSMALERALPVLSERGVPTFLVGTPAAARLNPGLDGYLFVSDAERYQRRITQFASHLAVQYVLDTLFGSDRKSVV